MLTVFPIPDPPARLSIIMGSERPNMGIEITDPSQTTLGNDVEMPSLGACSNAFHKTSTV